MIDIIPIPKNLRSAKSIAWMPVVPSPLADDQADIFSVIRSGDLLVHHPFESFTSSVERFLSAAADDDKVLAIKMTLYRTGDDSPFINTLVRAAEAGKQVVCLVEVKARFDEQRNIQVAQMLEKAGVHVVYGIVGLKTHAKIAPRTARRLVPDILVLRSCSRLPVRAQCGAGRDACAPSGNRATSRG